MLRVYKTRLNVCDEQIIKIKGLIKVLNVQVQNDEPCMWYLIDDSLPVKALKVVTHGTGHIANDTTDMTYIGTYLLLDGHFVGHVWVKELEDDING